MADHITHAEKEMTTSELDEMEKVLMKAYGETTISKLNQLFSHWRNDQKHIEFLRDYTGWYMVHQLLERIQWRKERGIPASQPGASFQTQSIGDDLWRNLYLLLVTTHANATCKLLFGAIFIYAVRVTHSGELQFNFPVLFNHLRFLSLCFGDS